MQTEWNFEPCTAQKVTVIVADTDQFPKYWARRFVGEERFAVEVTYNGNTFYVDNEDGEGWHKVVNGGSPHLPHKNLAISKVIARMSIW